MPTADGRTERGAVFSTTTASPTDGGTSSYLLSFRATEILGFKESDRNHLGMVFLRNGTDHHTFGLVPGPKDATVAPKEKYLTFHHMALEVPSVDDLFNAREFLTQHGIKFVFEGRRGAGCNVSL